MQRSTPKHTLTRPSVPLSLSLSLSPYLAELETSEGQQAEQGETSEDLLGCPTVGDSRGFRPTYNGVTSRCVWPNPPAPVASLCVDE